jgi:hypothetical protein
MLRTGGKFLGLQGVEARIIESAYENKAMEILASVTLLTGPLGLL